MGVKDALVGTDAVVGTEAVANRGVDDGGFYVNFDRDKNAIYVCLRFLSKT